MEPPEPTSEINKLFELARAGEIARLSKAELERYASVLASRVTRTMRRSDEFLQISDTVRTLLIVRMSEAANEEATRISMIALWIAISALICSVVQAAASLWSLVSKA